MACARLIFAAGASPGLSIFADSKGILHRERHDIYRRRAEFVDKWQYCQTTNADDRRGGIPEAMIGADAVIALSKPGPDTIHKGWVAAMADNAIVFACANPIPEIWPWEASDAGAAIVATGRSDFPNQVNNSLGFPGIFRGALDVRALTITDGMCLAAARALADTAVGQGLDAERILPTMEDWEVFPREAAAVAMKAQDEGVARRETTEKEEYERAERIIRTARDSTRAMMEAGYIPAAPELAVSQ